MPTKAGETARETGDLRCHKCHEKIRVTQGQKVPKCPNCGSNIYDDQPGRKM